MYLVHESVHAQERRGADQHGAEPDARHHQLGRGLGHLQSHVTLQLWCRLRMRHLVDPVGGDAGDHPGALHRHHRQAPDLSHAAQRRHVAEYLKLDS